MYILGQGRAAFLEFLRNLTTQAVLLAFILVAGRRLDFRHADLSNFWPTFGFFAIVAIWWMAAYANVTLFMERSLVQTHRVNRARRLLRARGLSSWRITLHAVYFSWRDHKFFFVEVVAVTVIIEVGLAISAASGVTTAATIVSNLAKH